MKDSEDRDMTPPEPMSRLRRWCRVIGLVVGGIAVAVLAVLMALSRPVSGQRPVRLLPPQMSHTESLRGQAVTGERFVVEQIRTQAFTGRAEVAQRAAP